LYVNVVVGCKEYRRGRCMEEDCLWLFKIVVEVCDCCCDVGGEDEEGTCYACDWLRGHFDCDVIDIARIGSLRCGMADCELIGLSNVAVEESVMIA